jgi:hypothetical protein
MDRFGNRVSTVARKYGRGRLDKKCVSFRVLQEVNAATLGLYRITHARAIWKQGELELFVEST